MIWIKRTPLYVWISLFLLGTVSLSAWADIGVSTLGIDMEVAPGGSVANSILVINNSDNPAHVEIRLSDFDWDIDGKVQIVPPGTLPRSLANYITFFPSEFVLPAGRGMAQPIRFIVSLPKEVTGPHWSLLSVREVTESPAEAPQTEGDERVVQATIGISFGVQIRQMDPTKVIRDGRITNAQVLLAQDGQPLRVITEFESLATTLLRVSGEVRFINIRGEIVAKVAIPPFRVLPAGKRRIQVPLQLSLPPGEYIALSILDFGGDFLIAGQVHFHI